MTKDQKIIKGRPIGQNGGGSFETCFQPQDHTRQIQREPLELLAQRDVRRFINGA